MSVDDSTAVIDNTIDIMDYRPQPEWAVAPAQSFAQEHDAVLGFTNSFST